MGELALPLGSMRWCGQGRDGQGRDTLLPTHPSLPVASRRPGPGVMRAGELSLLLTRPSTPGPAIHLGSRVELTLLVGTLLRACHLSAMW